MTALKRISKQVVQDTLVYGNGLATFKDEPALPTATAVEMSTLTQLKSVVIAADGTVTTNSPADPPPPPITKTRSVALVLDGARVLSMDEMLLTSATGLILIIAWPGGVAPSSAEGLASTLQERMTGTASAELPMQFDLYNISDPGVGHLLDRKTIAIPVAPQS